MASSHGSTTAVKTDSRHFVDGVAGRFLNVISLGAGVQSTTMALMAAHGEITPMPDAAIFADTGSEPKPVYEHLRWLMSPNVLPFPVHVVRDHIAGDQSLGDQIRAAARGEQRNDARPPFFVRNPPVGVKEGTRGRLKRQCTQDYKIRPIERKCRELVGLRPRQRNPKTPVVTQWIGISLDEIQRVKPSFEPWYAKRHPLIELEMRRWDCLRWLERHGYPEPPKSACTFCPYRRNESWRWLRDHDPDGFAEAVEVDATLRTGGYRSLIRGEAYVHDSLTPLAEVDLSTDDERGEWSMFSEECEGMCGV